MMINKKELFDELNNMKIVGDSYEVFKDRFSFPNIKFKITKEFKDFYENIKNEYVKSDPYKNNSKLIDFYTGLEDIMQKYGYTILDKLDLQYYYLPPIEVLQKIIKKYKIRQGSKKIKDIIDDGDNIITDEADKQDFINAYEALLEAINYIVSYPDYKVSTTGGRLVADDLLYIDTYFRKDYSVYDIVEDYPIISKNKRIVYNNEKEFLEVNKEIEDFIKLKFNEISKMYLQKFKTFIDNLEDTFIKGIDDGLVTIQLETKLSGKDISVVAETMIEHL